MLKTHVCLEVKKEERIYRFYCENNSPLGETYDAIKEIMNYVVSKIHEIEQTKKEENKTETKEGQ